MKITQRLIKKLLSKRFRDKRKHENNHYLNQMLFRKKRWLKHPDTIAWFRLQREESLQRRKMMQIISQEFKQAM